MSDNEAKIKRQLKIKTGSVKRLAKERSVYLKELDTLREKATKLSQERGNVEEWDVKNAHKLVKESEVVIVQTTAKLKDAVGELQDLVTSVETDERIIGDESLVTAQDVLKDTVSVADE